MPRDIRSYFQPKKTQQSKVQEDEDVIPESPDVQIKNRKKETKKKRVLIDDSDEEIFSTKQKTGNDTETSDKSKKLPKPALREVKPVDLFGGGSIKRTEPLVKKKKKTETGIHSDDEFEKSLLEIDSAELASPTNDSKASNSARTPKKSEKGSSAAKSPLKSEKTSDTEKSSKQSSSKETSSKSTNNDNLHLSKQSTNNDNLHSSKPSTNNDNLHSRKPSTNDVQKDKKHKQNNHSECSKDSKKSVNKSPQKQNNVGWQRLKKSKLDNSKRKFAEFLDDDTSPDHASGKKKKLDDDNLDAESKGKAKKNQDNELNSSSVEEMDVDDSETNRRKKLNKSHNESVLTDEERHERKIASAALYKSYLNRSGPKHLGAKEMPKGTPDCLKDCAFVLTGVLDSFEKEEVTAAINSFGGCVKSGVTKKVTHVLAGEDAGPAKIAKAEELGIKIINEDEFLNMIKDLSKKKSSHKPEIKKEIKKEQSPHKAHSKDKLKDKSSSKDKKDNHVDIKSKKTPEKVRLESKSSKVTSSKSKLDSNESKHHDKSKSPKKVKPEIKMEPKTEKKSEATESSSTKAVDQENGKPNTELPANSSMWVEKYKPQNIKQIIGQHGDASNVKKLINWLSKWYVNRKAKLPKPSPWAKNDSGGYYKAALLSGPPGVGKTTTVSLVCKELGFDMVEFNASDTRNKTLIREQIGELLTTTSLSGFAKGQTGKQAVTKKHVLVMDEVDGMAGNEDRGGLQELIGLIKSASVPIICMCNDRNSQKMRSLVNYCYDLRFSRPRVDQIKSAMMSICFKEGIKIPPDVLSQLITSANQDVRQTLNLLSMWAIDPTRTDADRLRKDAQISKKDVKLGPWDAIRKVFSAEDHKSMSINDRSDLFFYDYSLAPLFVQENYLQVVPHCPKHEVLQRISNAADSISLGDMIDARIRGNQAWSLLPIQAMYSSVIPGHEMSGHMAGQIQFPGWLGKNSRATKMRRLCQEIHAHTRLSTSGSKSSIYLDYAPHICEAIINPLIKDRTDGIAQSLEVLESYHLLREDLDSLVELSMWPGQRNPTVLIDPKVKAAMTRAYNKKATALPYAPGVVKRGRAKGDDDEEVDEQEDDDEPQDSDPENDAMIKKKKSKDANKPGSSKEKPVSKPATSKKKKET